MREIRGLSLRALGIGLAGLLGENLLCCFRHGGCLLDRYLGNLAFGSVGLLGLVNRPVAASSAAAS